MRGETLDPSGEAKSTKSVTAHIQQGSILTERAGTVREDAHYFSDCDVVAVVERCDEDGSAA